MLASGAAALLFSFFIPENTDRTDLMGTSVDAIITPSVLAWARESAGFSPENAASRLKVDVNLLLDWEAGLERPTVAKARIIAGLYKRPLALFYLPEPPKDFKPMHDFRRLPEAGEGVYSPELKYELRLAHERRELALQILEETDERPITFELRAVPGEAPELVGMRIREALGVTQSLQSTWRDNRIAFHAWRGRMEDLGVLVFQAARVDSAEASGFAFAASALPFVVVNRKDAWGRRVFSLMHELAHLMLHASGVSNIRTIPGGLSAEEQVEVYCNQVAAAALMPKLSFLSEHELAGQDEPSENWDEESISNLARKYSVSREAIVRRLLTFGLTTERFYTMKRQQYLEEYAAQKIRKREQQSKKAIARNMPRETINDAGRPFVQLLFDNYNARALTLSEVSGHLGLKTKHLESLERQLMVRG